MMSENKISFDEALNELENVVRQLEMGELPLEQSIELYKKGMELSGQCHQKLQKIEAEVTVLVDANGNTSDFEMAGK
ncbi:MAG: exodeoxyribonuclease VII small subunit [Turicibacter sp.]|nr:exodeoxyribonuclease VII small subunit [Turicibacter sp.]